MIAIGGLLKLKTDDPPGPVGVAGKGPGEAVYKEMDTPYCSQSLMIR